MPLLRSACMHSKTQTPYNRDEAPDCNPIKLPRGAIKFFENHKFTLFYKTKNLQNFFLLLFLLNLSL